MSQSDKHIPNDENTRLLQTDEAKVNSGRKICRKTVPPKRYIRLKNSDGSLDFERIVNLYSIQGKTQGNDSRGTNSLSKPPSPPRY